MADLFFLDWMMFCKINPKFLIIPGTEGNKGYQDYKFHLIGFLKGLIICCFSAFLLGSIC